MPDPIISAARRSAAEAFEVLRTAVKGLDAATLNRRAAGEETNSIAVLTTHALMSTRMHVHVALGLPVPARDRPAEFATNATGPEPLLKLIDTIGGECLAVLDAATAPDWSVVRTFTRGDGTKAEMTAAWALVHGIDHLRGHADEAGLTRHVLTAAH
jgi:hypothetical protein